jgi:4-amino-4-deoxy-L-arabinose transferase-like glycosyltransferase
MKNWISRYWPLLLIITMALVLRVYKVSEYPVGVTWDEPALGYNAYSILKTARDEYGHFLPVTFKSFGDYKPGLFIYFLVPFVAIFGLTKFAIRFPSGLVGVGSVIAIFFLTQEIIKEKKFKHLPYLAALILALSPWQIHFSRGAWEANLALLTIILAIFFFLKLLAEKKKKYLIASALFWAISAYTYHGAKVFLICFTTILVFLMWPEIKSWPTALKRLAVIVGLVLLIPLFASFKGSANRARVMSVFSYTRPVQAIQEILTQENSFYWLNYVLFHSEPLNMAKGVLGRYFNHLSGKFLFFEGDWSSPRHSAPYMGMVYLVEIPFLLLGIGHFLASGHRQEKSILFAWLLTAPIPAAITRDIVHGIRSYWMVVPLAIFTATGIFLFFDWCRKQGKMIFYAGGLALIFGYAFCLFLYLDIYYVHFPKLNSAGWNYGADRVAAIVEEAKPKYNNVVVTQKYGQPYIFYLFYTRYDPRRYQPQAFLKEDPNGDVGIVEKIDNIEFKAIYWPVDRNRKKTLFIGTPEELPLNDIAPGQSRVIEEITFLDGRIAYRVVETL